MRTIHTLIEDAARLRTEANRQITSITDEIDALYLDDIPVFQSAFAVNSRMLNQAFGITQELRLEASFYSRPACWLEEKLKGAGAKTLSTYCHNIRRSTLRERVMGKTR